MKATILEIHKTDYIYSYLGLNLSLTFMTPERIKLFLRCFYEQYILDCYQGYDVDTDQESLSENLGKYDINGYFLKYLDIYIENTDFMKEYSVLYNPALFDVSREQNPEVFNELQIFLIENIQLFLHTILETAINTQSKTSKINGLKLYMKPIDNKSIRLIELVEKAEKKMTKLQVLPPAMG
jgi:hypothetical protein